MTQKATQHHVVCLEECHCAIPTLPFPHQYTGYVSTTREEVVSKLKDATIAITTIIPITPHVLDQCPKLKCVFAMSTGTDWVDRPEFKRRGVTVINAPQTNVATVSEHALALYFSARRQVVDLHNRLVGTDEYAARSTMTHHFRRPPRTCTLEIMAVIGYGHLGKHIAKMATALGMKVLIADRKGAATPREGRTSFETSLKEASIIVITAPKSPETLNLISEAELKTMREDAILINVARGGIVDEAALVSALKDGRIGGAATDVYEREPPHRGQSPLLDGTIPNLILSPHLAWFSQQTLQNLQDSVVLGLSSYVAGTPVNVVI